MIFYTFGLVKYLFITYLHKNLTHRLSNNQFIKGIRYDNSRWSQDKAFLLYTTRQVLGMKKLKCWHRWPICLDGTAGTLCRGQLSRTRVILMITMAQLKKLTWVDRIIRLRKSLWYQSCSCRVRWKWSCGWLLI